MATLFFGVRFNGILTSLEQKEEGAEEDAPPKLVWISDAEANI